MVLLCRRVEGEGVHIPERSRRWVARSIRDLGRHRSRDGLARFAGGWSDVEVVMLDEMEDLSVVPMGWKELEAEQEEQPRREQSELETEMAD